MIPTRAAASLSVAVLIALLLGGEAFAGPSCEPVFVRELDTVPLFDSLGPVPRPFHGGWHNARPELLDIDADGDLDLFVAEETGRLRFYRNEGSSSAPSWSFETDDYAGVHDLFFCRFSDYDSDGDFDLLVEAPKFEIDLGGQTAERTGAYLYTNVGTPQAAVFQNLSTHPDGYFTDDTGEPIQFETTAPDFVDIEGDGDEDLLYGDQSGAVALYRNVGSAGSPVFQWETDSYQGLLITFGGCGGTRRTAAPGRGIKRHGFMLFSFFDIDSDDDPDMFVGDQFNPNVYFYENIGGAQSPFYSCVTDVYFPDSTGAAGFFSQYLVSAFGDLDGDQAPEALLGSGVSAFDGLFYYTNDGTPTAPDLRMAASDYLPEFDLGWNSAPGFHDLDGDGDTDMLLGLASPQIVSYWDNVGDAGSAAFGLVQEDYLTTNGAIWAAPEFADLDGDDDLDLFLGTSSGGIRYFRNDSPGPGAPVFNEITTDPDFGDVFGRTFRTFVESQAVPRFLDGDDDGDLDVLVGYWDFNEALPTLLYFRNDAAPPAHSFVFETADYQGLGTFGQNLAPALGDIDGDGDRDLLVGSTEGTIALCRNVGTPGRPAFVRETDTLGGIDVGATSVPALVDLDADDDLDLVVGESGGGLNLFRNVTASGAPGPSGFALIEPLEGAAVNGRFDQLFRWESSAGSGRAAVQYELRLAAGPASPQIVVSGLAQPEASVRLWATSLRNAPEVWWTVVATEGCGSAPVPEWRRLVHSTFADDPDLAELRDVHSEPAPGAPGRGARPSVLEITRVTPVPSRTDVTIDLALPRSAAVRLTIYDTAGRRVVVLLDETRPSGVSRVRWNGRTGRGTLVAPGVYLARVEALGRSHVKRIVRLR